MRIALLLALLFVAPAVADEAGFPFDIPKQNPAALKAWHAVVPKQYRSEAWIYNFDGVSSPNRLIMLSGRQYILGSVCKPHDCGDNQIAFLLAVNGSRALGKIGRWHGKPGSDFGSPTIAESDLLQRRLDDPNGDPPAAKAQ